MSLDLSVIIPVYNTAPYLEACLRSIVAQEDVSLEIIIINDGSTDNSMEVVHAFIAAHHDKKFLVIEQANAGQGAARNAGMKVAKGEYIAFVDSDDFLVPGIYAQMVDLGRKQQCDVVLCKGFLHNHHIKTNPHSSHDWLWDKIMDGRPQLVTNAIRHPQILMLEFGPPFRVLRTDYVRRIDLSFIETIIFEDFPFHFRSLMPASKIGLLAERGYCYRIGHSGQTISTRGRCGQDVFVAMDIAVKGVMPLQPDWLQGAYIVLAMLNLLDWRSRYAEYRERKDFFERAIKFFATIPPQWIARAEREFIVSLKKQIFLLALCHNNVDLLIAISSGRPVQLRTTFLLLRLHRYRTLWYHGSKFVKTWATARKGKDKDKGKGKNEVETKSNTKTTPVTENTTEGITVPSTSWGKVHRAIKNITPLDVYTHNYEQLTETSYGHHLFNVPRGTIILDLQEDSGLLAFRLACWRRVNNKIFVVCRSSGRRRDLQQIADDNLLDNISFFANVEEAEAAIDEMGMAIGLLKVDRSYFEAPLLKRLLDKYRVIHALGTFDEAAMARLDLYRSCKKKTQAFYWFNTDSREIVAGNHSTKVEVSIVVPIHNIEKYLEKCLQSLVEQTIVSKEIILVDDGSTDSSGAIADAWQQRYPDIIKVIHKANGGCASSRSAGLAAATGEYVGFIDGDDWVDPPMFEQLYESSALARSEVAQCGFRYYYEQTNTYEDIKGFFVLTNVNQGRAGVVKNITHVMTIEPAIWRRLYRTDYLRNFKIDFPHHIKNYDDLFFYFVSLHQATRVSVIPEVYYNYRLQRTGQSVEATDERWFIHFDIFSLIKNEVQEKGNFHTEMVLKKLQISHHNWVLGKIAPAHRRVYKKKMAHDLFEGRCYVTAPDIFILAGKFSRKVLQQVLQMYAYYVLPKFMK